MTDKKTVSLQKLREALQQPNNGIRKRALAIIFNDVRVEAIPVMEEYAGRETEPALQTLALKVLKKLREFQTASSNVPLDRLLELVQVPHSDSRLLALRAMAALRSDRIPPVLVPLANTDLSPEGVELISQILRNNPSTDSIPVFMKFIGHPSEKVRLNAIEGFLNIMYGCLFPQVLNALLDPSPPIKMRAYQLISNISRSNLLDTLSFMLESSAPELSRQAAKLLPSFLNPDLIPLLERHCDHPDGETSSFCRRTLVLLAQKGHLDAVNLLEELTRKESADPNSAGPAPENAQGEYSTLAPIFAAPFQGRRPTDNPQEL